MKKYFNLNKYRDHFYRKGTSIFWSLMKIDIIRFNLCKLRWNYLKKNMKVLEKYSNEVGQTTVEYNLTAFNSDAVFGMAKRMSLLLYPIAALLRDYDSANLLIVGPRSEDDIFWAKSLGIKNTMGLDLFSYSDFIQIGDIHSTDFADNSFDAILLGWMINYSSNPNKVIQECKRLIKPNGYLGIGIQSDPAQRDTGISPPRVNSLNSPPDLVDLVNEEVVFIHDLKLDVPYECAVILKIDKKQ